MGYRGKRLGLTGLAGVILCLNCAQAYVDLEPPPEGFYQPTDRFTFRIPADVPPEVLQRLSLELNAIDVTAFVAREGEHAIFAPPQPLPYGTHRLRLVEHAVDGAINELALWNVEVRRGRAFREAGVTANLDLIGNGRLAERNVPADVSDTTAQGALGVDARVADGNWQLRTRFGLLHNSQAGMMPDGQRTDLAHGLVEGSRGSVTIRAGDHLIPATGLIMRDFARRGISGSARLDALRSELTAFAMRTEAVSGFHHGFGVGDSGHRTDGAVLGISPLADRPERLHIALMHLDGSGSVVGGAMAGDDEAGKGDASSLSVDSLLHEQRWRLRAELARSNSGFADVPVPAGSETDTAYSLLAAYTHPQRIARGSAFTWNVGAERTTVGPFFFSLGNPTLAADRRLHRVFSGINWGGWSLTAQLARETDNVDDDPNLPRLRSDYLTLGSHYTSAWEPRSEGFMRLFKRPGVALILQDMDQRHDRVPAAFAGDRVDQGTRVLYGGLRFTPGSWAWDVSHTLTRFEDTVGTQPDYHNGLTEFGLDMMVGDRYTIRPRIQYNRLRDRDAGITTSTTTAGLGLWAALIPGRVDANLDYSLNRERTDDDSANTDTYSVNGMLNWQLRLPRENRPGISLFTSGSYFSNGGEMPDSSDIYQIFAGVRIGWPVAY